MKNHSKSFMYLKMKATLFSTSFMWAKLMLIRCRSLNTSISLYIGTRTTGILSVYLPIIYENRSLPTVDLK